MSATMIKLDGGDRALIEGSIRVPVQMDERELVQFLAGIKGAAFLTFKSDTEASLYRSKDARHNPFPKGDVRKKSRINAALNVNYGRAVNRQREREGKTADFKAEGRRWGESLRGSPFVVHTTKTGEKRIYLEAMVLRGLEKPVYYSVSTGMTVPVEYLKPFLKKSKTDRQELDKPVEWRTFKLESIRELKARKMTVIPGWTG